MAAPVPIAFEEDLTEEAERRRTGEVGHGHLLAWQRWEAGAKPLVLVHGIRDCPLSLLPLARAFEASHQVLFYVYDDVDRYLDRSGDDLSRALVDLAPSGRLGVVAHSMGGIVARAALNSLVDPHWFPLTWAPRPGGVAEPVSGAATTRRPDAPAADRFVAIDLVTIDTPWHGFIDAPIPVRNRLPESSLGDMVASSALFSALFKVPWPAHFAVDYIEANNVAAGAAADKVQGLAERADTDLDGVVRLIVDGGAPGDAMTRNEVAALRSEHDFAELRETLVAERALGTLDRARFQAILDARIPTIPSSHVSILSNPALPGHVAAILARGEG